MEREHSSSIHHPDWDVRMSDVDGFDRFVQEHQRALLRSAWLLCNDWHLAEDLVQQALMEVWRRWPRVRDGANPGGYAYTVMIHAHLSVVRRNNHLNVIQRMTGEQQSVPRPIDEAVNTRDQLVRLLAILTPRQRAVLICRYFLDQTEGETARILGCRLGTVKSHAARALRTLEAELRSSSTDEDGVAHAQG